MIVGISVVRNEADIIELCLRHHLAQGIELIFICDDDSSDGTQHLLQQLSVFDTRIRWFRNSLCGFYQAQIVNDLARQAVRLGAEWIIVFDADEFWYSPQGVAQTIRAEAREAQAIVAEVINFVQRRTQKQRDPRAATRAQYRVALPRGHSVDTFNLVRSGAISYVEMQYLPKRIFRAGPGLEIFAGAHDVPGRYSRALLTSIRCLHVPLRAKEVLLNKIEQSARLDRAGFEESHGWHLRYFARQDQMGCLDDEWAANSELGGYLDAKRGRISLLYDPTLPNLLGPLAN